MKAHGKLDETGRFRYCRDHGEHGPLYRCPSYDSVTLGGIEASTAKLRANLSDPNWTNEQLNRGIDPFAIHISRIFAGME